MGFFVSTSNRLVVNNTGNPVDCSTCPCGCGVCAKCNARTPCSIQVVFSGIVDALNCTNCDLINGTYVLTKTTAAAGCNWTYFTSSGFGCGFFTDLDFHVRELLSSGILKTAVDVLLETPGSFSMSWIHYFASTATVDCTTFNSFAVPFVGGSGYGDKCDPSGSSCLITAL